MDMMHTICLRCEKPAVSIPFHYDELGMKLSYTHYSYCEKCLRDGLKMLKEHEPRVMTLDEAAAAQEVWVETWFCITVMVTVLYPTDDCKNFELELLGRNEKAFMLTEAYGRTWRCWTAKPTYEQRQAVKWDGE